MTGRVLVPLALVLTILYGAYRICASSTGSVFVRPCGTAVGAAPRGGASVRGRGRGTGEPAMPAFVVKPLAVRATDLIGSLLVAAAVTAAMCVVMLLIEAYRGMPLQIEQCAWLYLVSLAGAWLVLIAAKFWEGSQGERMLRHFILMIVGFGLGLAAFGVAEVFLVRLASDHDLTNRVNEAAPIGFLQRSTRTAGRWRWPTWRSSPRSWPFCGGGWTPIRCEHATEPLVAAGYRGFRTFHRHGVAVPRAVADDGCRLHVGFRATVQPLGADLRPPASPTEESDLAKEENHGDLLGYLGSAVVARGGLAFRACQRTCQPPHAPFVIGLGPSSAWGSCSWFLLRAGPCPGQRSRSPGKQTR